MTETVVAAAVWQKGIPIERLKAVAGLAFVRFDNGFKELYTNGGSGPAPQEPS